MKSAESNRSASKGVIEIYPEVGGVADRPGVYKISMARMADSLTKTANERVLKPDAQKCACATSVYVWESKTSSYEIPYAVTGSIKHTGSKRTPKDIM